MSYLESMGLAHKKEEQPAPTEAVVEQPASTDVATTEQPNEQPPSESVGKEEQQVIPANEDEIISRLTGGAVTTVADFQTNYSKWQELSSKGEVDVNSIKEQAKQEAFANPFVKELNELVQKGADQNQIKTFFELSNIGDISSLSTEEALARKMSIEDGISLNEALLFIKTDLKTEDDFLEQASGDEDRAKVLYRRYQLGLEKEAKQAKEFLQSTKKDIYEGVVEKSNKPSEAQVRFQELHGKWEASKQVVASNLLTTANQKVEIKDDKSGIDYSFDIKVPQEYIANLIPEISTFAAQNGLSVDEKGLGAIKDQILGLYISENFNSIAESLVRDAHAKAIKKEVEKNSNPVPLGGVQVHQQSTKPKDDPYNPSVFFK